MVFLLGLTACGNDSAGNVSAKVGIRCAAALMIASDGANRQGKSTLETSYLAGSAFFLGRYSVSNSEKSILGAFSLAQSEFRSAQPSNDLIEWCNYHHISLKAIGRNH